MKIGFIGLGVMGRPMANNLVNNGYDVIAYDVVPEFVAEAAKFGATAAASIKEAVCDSEIVITMLPNGSHVKSVALGEGGLAENAKQGTLLIDMSSISTTDSIEINESLKEKGLRMIDAPVSGAFTGALEGKLAIMVGGEEADVKDAMPVLSCMGSKIVHIGPAGSGCTCKLANNIIIANNLAAVCEAMMFAKKAGCDLNKVFEVISAGFAGSTAMNSQVPRMLAQNYEPGFTIKLHHKDLTNALAAGANVNSPMPLAQHMKDVMDEMIEDGLGLKDNSGIALYYEKLANDKYVD